jgi:peptide-methionine (S)-S-oxide reductase
MIKHIFLLIFLGAHLMSGENETIVLGAGCFWCVEAVYERIDGVISVEAAYAGGNTDTPTYKEVCSGETGHAEVAKITFDPEKVKTKNILEVFWKAHDPTTLNRQGADVGTQYRSAIFFLNDKQKITAEKSLREAQTHFNSPIVTVIAPLEKYYPAEDYHQNYYNNNKNAPYCQFVIQPKLEKLNLVNQTQNPPLTQNAPDPHN